MRTAICSALLAAIPVLCCAMGDQAAPAHEAAQQQQGEQQNALPKTPQAPPVETDPTKMAAPPAAPKVQAPADKTYVIGPEDVVSVTVWSDGRLSGDFLVRPDGFISMNLINDVEAAGKTPEQLQTVISDILKAREILKNPSVNVQVKAINSKKYFLQGEVNKPGSYSLVVPTTILEALVNAGGFRDFANERKIMILRGTERFSFNFKDAIKGKHPEKNILLKPGDIIIVP